MHQQNPPPLNFNTKRRKRDDGSFAQDFGGPVAQSTGPEDDDVVPVNSGNVLKQPENQAVTGPIRETVSPAQQPSAIPPSSSKMCAFEKKENQVLSIVSNNKRTKRSLVPVNKAENFEMLKSANCETYESCSTMCQSIQGCNYVMRSSVNFISYFYKVKSEVLNGNDFTTSISYDSVIVNCENGSSVAAKSQLRTEVSNGAVPAGGNNLTPQTLPSTLPPTTGPTGGYNMPQQILPPTLPPTIVPAGGYNLPPQTLPPTLPPTIVPAGGYNLPPQTLPPTLPPTTAKPKCAKLISEKDAKDQFDDYLKTFNEKYLEPVVTPVLTPAPQPIGGYGIPPPAPTLPPSPPTPPPQKSYSDPTEYERRLQIFKDNLQIIQRSNCSMKDDPFAAQLQITEFSDQTYEEFIKESGGSLAELGEEHLKPDVLSQGKQRLEKCKKLNWSELGFVPEPRKQSKCGSCYAFSTSDLVAAQYHIDRKLKGQSLKLAPQYILDCMKEPAALGCNGGRPIEVLRNFTKCTEKVGCNWPQEDCYPYQNKKTQCKIEECQKTPKIPIRFAVINDLTGPNEKEKIAALLNWGPAVAIVDAGRTWQLYGGQGVIRSGQCTENQNHAVLLVGYDYTGPVPFYIVKNSWGSKWGDKGFIKLEADKNTCAIAKSVTLVCTHNCDKFKDSTDMANRPNSENC